MTTNWTDSTKQQWNTAFLLRGDVADESPRLWWRCSMVTDGYSVFILSTEET